MFRRKRSTQHFVVTVFSVSIAFVNARALADEQWPTLGRYIQSFIIELPSALESPKGKGLKITSPTERQDCSDLFSVSCAPGYYDDGTAVMKTPTLDDSSGITYLKKIFDRARKDFQVAAVWDPIIRKKENLRFVEKVIKFGHLEENPHCAEGKEQTKNCLALVKHKLVSVSEDLVLEQARYFYQTGEVLEEDESPPESITLSEPYGSLVNFERDVTKTGVGLFEQGHAHWLKIVPRAALPLMKARVRDIETRIFPDLRSILSEIVTEKVTNPAWVDPIALRIRLLQYKGDILCNPKHALVGLLNTDIKISQGKDGDPFIRTCGLFLDRNPSEYALVFHLAKKMASVTDPCSITGKIPGTDKGKEWIIPNPGLNERDADKNYPIGSGLLACLRSRDSAHARGTGLILEPPPTPTPTAVPTVDKTPVPIPEVAATPNPTALYCTKSTEEHFDSDGELRPKDDQVIEAFTDWAATEALARWVEKYHMDDLAVSSSDRIKIRNGYSNVFRSLCRVATDRAIFRNDLLRFPALDRRINGILLSHPRVREQMSCPIFYSERSCSGNRIEEWNERPIQFEGENESSAPKPIRSEDVQVQEN